MLKTGIFEDYTIAWQDRTYTIPANSILKTIASVEAVITYGELVGYAQRRAAPLATLSKAYAIVLRSAGAFVTDDEVYAGMFGLGGTMDTVLEAINGLFHLMTPPAAREETAKGSKPGNSRRATAASSKPSTKRSLGRRG